MDEIIALRKIAVAWLEWACRHDTISESDPRYISITEGRDVGKYKDKYSSCGDLAHWMLYRIGVRLPWVNRQEHEGWQVGANIINLWPSRPGKSINVAPAERPMIGQPMTGGDVILIWNHTLGYDAHAICVIDRIGDTLLTAEYGQPGGALREHKIRRDKHAEYIGRRKIQWVLSLSNVVAQAQPSGLMAAPELPPGD